MTTEQSLFGIQPRYMYKGGIGLFLFPNPKISKVTLGNMDFLHKA